MAEMLDKIVQKTSGAINIAKLKLKLATKQADLDEAYENLGRALFIQISDGTDMDEEIAALVAKVDKLNTEIEKSEREIAQLQGKRVCVSCGKINSKSATYCGKCGEDLNGQK
ncbi:MAG: zinc-ribbon domain-containing protein [Clostridia bacterium]|nr:zinc-ribbon domain-containing protein [Clostridia bacterium]